MEEQCKLLTGGEGNGHEVCPQIISLSVTSFIVILFSTDDHKFFGFITEHLPLKPKTKPLHKPSII